MSPPLISRLERAIAKRDRKTAIALAEQALATRIEHPAALKLVAEARTATGQFDEAGGLINRALAFNRADPDALRLLAIVLHREGRTDEAIDVFGQALSLNPGDATAWLWLGRALAVLDQDGPSTECFERSAAAAAAQAAANKDDRAAQREALALEGAAWGGMSEVHMRAGKTPVAETAALKAVHADPFQPLGNWTLGRIALSRGDADGARTRIEPILVRGQIDAAERQILYHLLGDAMDRLGRVPEAYKAYVRMNEALVQQHQARFGPKGPVENHLSFIHRLSAGYAAANTWDTAPAEIAPSPVRQHIFVMGYLRSGNTLASSVLGALPDARVMEERRTLMDADFAFLRDAETMARLATVGVEEAEEQRQLYWQRVRDETPDVDGKIFIDMAPMNSIKLPVIHKLFPSAKIIICRRDPRDVVLSCFRQNFNVNATTFQMTSLESTARHFAAAMELQRDNLTRIGGAHYLLNYETFVADFEAKARELVAFTGLDWDDRALNFSAAAKDRRLRTASAAQVRSGLFDGSRQWMRYADYLKLVTPLLEPFAS